MKTENEKYDKLLSVLRKSKPRLLSPGDIEREVINIISKKGKHGFNISDAVDFLFNWIYIGWVRRTLITASVVLVAVFILQQGIILKEIGDLRTQTISNDLNRISGPDEIIEKKLLMYKTPGRIFHQQTITISKKQMDQLLDSVNELQDKYRHLMELIEEDPALKKIIENRLTEKRQPKTNL